MRKIVTACLLSLLALATGCPPAGPASNEALDHVRARGKLIVGMDVGYDPFEIIDPADPENYAGFDVDLVNAVAKDLGVGVELKNVSWNAIVPALQTGKVDVIVSGMSITAERQKTVDFSEPYFEIGQVVVKRKGDERIKSWQDLNKAGIVVAVQDNTTGETAVAENMPDAEILEFEKMDLACLAVQQEKADAVVFDHPYLKKYVAIHGAEMEGLWEAFTKEPVGAAFRKDSPALRRAFDETLARLEASGELETLKAKWFAPAEAASTGE